VSTSVVALSQTIPNLLAEAYALLPNADKKSAARLGAIGMELESRSRFAHARPLLERALQIDPLSRPEWYWSLAFAHFRDVTGAYAADGERIILDGIEETDSDYLKALYLSIFEGSDDDVADMVEYLAASSDLGTRFALGYSLLWRGAPERALTLLRETADELGEGVIAPGLDSYCGAMNWMRAQGMDIDLKAEVLPTLERLIRFYPTTYNYRALTIQLFQILHEYDAVVQTASETLRVFPDEETTMLALGVAHEKLGDDDSAALWYNRAIGAKPSFARARVMLGKLYERLGRLALAEEVFRDIHAAFPEYYAGKLEIAYFLRRAGKRDEASSLFRYAFDHLKTFEKAAVESHPEGKLFLAEMVALDLPIIVN
jgi:tetratricopeptide (TPR) repeat protein